LPPRPIPTLRSERPTPLRKPRPLPLEPTPRTRTPLHVASYDSINTASRATILCMTAPKLGFNQCAKQTQTDAPTTIIPLCARFGLNNRLRPNAQHSHQNSTPRATSRQLRLMRHDVLDTTHSFTPRTQPWRTYFQQSLPKHDMMHSAIIATPLPRRPPSTPSPLSLSEAPHRLRRSERQLVPEHMLTSSSWPPPWPTPFWYLPRCASLSRARCLPLCYSSSHCPSVSSNPLTPSLTSSTFVAFSTCIRSTRSSMEMVLRFVSISIATMTCHNFFGTTRRIFFTTRLFSIPSPSSRRLTTSLSIQIVNPLTDSSSRKTMSSKRRYIFTNFTQSPQTLFDFTASHVSFIDFFT
jgi:hypothetical protein